MNDQGRKIDDPQTAFLRTEGELRLNGAPNPKAPPRCACKSNYKAPADTPGSHSGTLTRAVGHASGSPKTIQSP
jgi:hypothetical protein